MQEDLVLRGSFEESSLPELLRSVCRNKESGELICSDSGFRKSLYMNEGLIIFASSHNPDDRLGESLLRNGKISVRNLIEASRHVRSGKRLGAVLCDMKALTPEELVEGIRTQVRDMIRDMFKITSGPYELALKPIDTQEMILLNTTSEDIIFDGVKSIQSWARISHGIGSLSSRVFPAPDSEKILLSLNLTQEESHLFTIASRGQFSIEEICGISYFTNFETCRLLWSFLMVGALQVADSGQETPGQGTVQYVAPSAESEYDLMELVENYNDLYSYIYDYAYQRIEEGAEELAGTAMEIVQDAMPNITRNVSLDSYGRLDFDSLLVNLSSLPEDNRKEVLTSALEELVYALLYQMGSRFGPEHQKTLTAEIQKMRKG